MDLDTLGDRYRRDGFVVLRAALDEAEVARFRAAAMSLLERERLQPTAADGYRKVILQVHRASAQEPELGRLIRHPRLASIASLIGQMPRMRVFLDQVIAKEPSGRETIPHQDAPFLSFTDPRSLNCWVALDQVTRDNGALFYFAGSHHQGNLGLVHLDGHEDVRRRCPGLADCQIILTEMSPGDAVFHSCLSVHGAFANQTAAARIGFSIQYMPDGVSYNGWRQPFLDPYGLDIGDPLDQDCFPLVGGLDMSAPPRPGTGAGVVNESTVTRRRGEHSL